MSEISIQFENIGKLYKLGTVGTGTLSHDLNRWWRTAILHQEDPYLKIGEINDRSKKGNSDYVWALKNISFDVKQGDVVGIIGKNGAGKSTLLKLLSRVTTPTTGSIRVRGRIASLLEVGTGFHPELTGRENIFMNGSIMGMTKVEINRKFDEIVDFAGIERYIDTPVKRYSSGMTVRLGFAIAAFLEPEILVVDEVLAVGDAEFQKKALGKMKDVSQGDGRTVLFVSHNMDSMLNLCNTGILMENGLIKYSSSIADTVSHYIEETSYKPFYQNTDSSKPIYINELSLKDQAGNKKNSYSFAESMFVEVQIRKRTDYLADKRCILGIELLSQHKNKIFTIEHPIEEINKGNEIIIQAKLPGKLFAPGNYSFTAALHTPNIQLYDHIKDVCGCKILDNGTDYLKYNGVNNGVVIIKPEWVSKI